MKKDYLSRLERAARWRLPRQEAEDVIADYRDIIGDPPRRSEELYRDLGKPWNVIKPLAAPRAYYTWLAAFTVMTACILIPGLSPHAPFWRIWDKCFAGPFNGGWGRFGFSHWGPVLAGTGLIGSLAWSRWKGTKEDRLPRTFFILFAVLAVWCGTVLLVDWLCMRDLPDFANRLGKVPSLIFPEQMVSLSARILTLALQYGGAIAALLGVFGLVRARTGDRRWAAVYILAMTAMLVSMESLALFISMSMPSSVLTDAGWYLPHLRYYIAITIVGLVGTGVALC